MSLRIIKSTDILTVEQLVLCIYSPPGIGKTSLAFSAESPLLLDFDGGAYRSGNRGDCVAVNTWAEAAGISAADLAGYKTLIIDTAGRALDALTVDIIQGNPKMGNRGGALTLQGYGELKSRFIAFTKLVRSFGLDIVLLAHSDEQRSGDELIERIDVQGGSKNEIYKAADVMGRLSIKQGKRFLNFSPTDTAFGKNPASLGELTVPTFVEDSGFLGHVIAEIKTKLNSATAEQQKAATALTDWQSKIVAASGSAESLNALIPDVAKADATVIDNVKRLVVKIGKEKGFEWDTNAKRFLTNGNGSSNGAFNPLSQTNKDGMTAKQAKSILTLTGALNVEPDESASKLFNLKLTVDDLSKEAADRFIADLTARAESTGVGALLG